VRLEQALVLNRYLHSRLGVRGLNDLKHLLSGTKEGVGGDGQSYFFHALASQKNLLLTEEKLRVYDARIMGYETRLAKARGSFSFKYFQYLALLYTEIFLDRLTEDPTGFLNDLNLFLAALKTKEPSIREEFADFTSADLRRLAFPSS
jgi:hypothetical protein